MFLGNERILNVFPRQDSNILINCLTCEDQAVRAPEGATIPINAVFLQ